MYITKNRKGYSIFCYFLQKQIKTIVNLFFLNGKITQKTCTTLWTTFLPTVLEWLKLGNVQLFFMTWICLAYTQTHTMTRSLSTCSWTIKCTLCNGALKGGELLMAPFLSSDFFPPPFKQGKWLSMMTENSDTKTSLGNAITNRHNI